MSNSGDGEFTTTHWSLIAAAQGAGDSGAAERALESLCRRYWYPLYVYVRRRVADQHEAQDLTQQFFSELLEKRTLQAADPERGRFRSFLLASLNHFLLHQWQKGRAQKRGGGVKTFSLDDAAPEARYRWEPADNETPEVVFARQWAMTVLEHALRRLRERYRAAGNERQYDVLQQFLTAAPQPGELVEAARKMHLSEGATRVALHRLRDRYRQALRDELLPTVADPKEVDDELCWLREAFGG